MSNFMLSAGARTLAIVAMAGKGGAGASASDIPKVTGGDVVATGDAKKIQALEVGGRKFRIKQMVTRTVLTQQDDVMYAVRFTAPIYQAEPLKTRGRNPDMPPPHLVEIDNLETGELQTLICNAVFKDRLEEVYPDGTYVNKCVAFRSKLHDAAGGGGKKFRLYQIAEIEDEPMTEAEVKAIENKSGDDGKQAAA